MALLPQLLIIQKYVDFGRTDLYRSCHSLTISNTGHKLLGLRGVAQQCFCLGLSHTALKLDN